MGRELKKIKNALEEHLTAINENTAEIQALFDFLQQMENKVERLSQRLDQLQLSQKLPLEKPQITPLNHLEKKIFLVLYTEETPLTYAEIAQKTGLSPCLIPEGLSSLSEKGIPIARTFSNEQMFFKIQPSFKELQAKENLVNLSLESFM